MTDADNAFHALLSQDPNMAVILVNRQGDILWWSEGARLMFGHEAAQALGASAQMLVPPELRAAHVGCFARGFAVDWTGSAGWDAIEGWAAGNTRLALEVFLTPLRDANGDVTGVLGLFRRPPAN